MAKNKPTGAQQLIKRVASSRVGVLFVLLGTAVTALATFSGGLKTIWESLQIPLQPRGLQIVSLDASPRLTGYRRELTTDRCKTSIAKCFQGLANYDGIPAETPYIFDNYIMINPDGAGPRVLIDTRTGKEVETPTGRW